MILSWQRISLFPNSRHCYSESVLKNSTKTSFNSRALDSQIDNNQVFQGLLGRHQLENIFKALTKKAFILIAWDFIKNFWEKLGFRKQLVIAEHLASTEINNRSTLYFRHDCSSCLRVTDTQTR